jgi:aerobic-type carbon monoxide dehydrogenase small subunit (CoxS/CutS family)
MRIEEHPILSFESKQIIHFTFNGLPMEGRQGDTIASALHASGVWKLSESIEHHRPRGFYCAIGNCASCDMTVNKKPNVRTCITLLEEGMEVTSQQGKGVLL